MIRDKVVQSSDWLGVADFKWDVERDICVAEAHSLVLEDYRDREYNVDGAAAMLASWHSRQLDVGPGNVPGALTAVDGGRQLQRGVRRLVTNVSDEVSDDEVDEGVGR